MSRAPAEADAINDSRAGVGIANKPIPEVVLGPVPPISIDFNGGTTEKGASVGSTTVFQSLGELSVTSLKISDQKDVANANYGSKTCECPTAHCSQGCPSMRTAGDQTCC